jgi:hypothetical protein
LLPLPPAPAPAPRAVPPWAWDAALVALVVVAYLPALGNGWIWDDDDYVTANQALRSLHGLWQLWFEPGVVPQYYPVTFTSLWVEWQLWGSWAPAFHVTNVLLHAANAVLAWRVLDRLGVPGAWIAGRALRGASGARRVGGMGDRAEERPVGDVLPDGRARVRDTRRRTAAG